MDVNWEMLLSSAVEQLIKIFVPVFLVLILKWCVEIWKKLSEKNPDLARLIAYAAQIGYAAAEDYFRTKAGITGEDKMVYAISRAKEYLSNAGVSIPDEDVIRDSITQYGLANYKFTWAKPTFNIADMLGPMSTEEGDVNEPSLADYYSSRYSDNGHHTDRDQSGQQSAGRDQEAAADKD